MSKPASTCIACHMISLFGDVRNYFPPNSRQDRRLQKQSLERDGRSLPTLSARLFAGHPRLTGLFEVARLRLGACEKHPPQIVYVMLFGLGLGGSLLAGFGMAAATARSWIHMLIFAATSTVTLYTVTDMEYPRLGIIRIENLNHFSCRCSPADSNRGMTSRRLVPRRNMRLTPDPRRRSGGSLLPALLLFALPTGRDEVRYREDIVAVVERLSRIMPNLRSQQRTYAGLGDDRRRKLRRSGLPTTRLVRYAKEARQPAGRGRLCAGAACSGPAMTTRSLVFPGLLEAARLP